MLVDPRSMHAPKNERIGMPAANASKTEERDCPKKGGLGFCRPDFRRVAGSVAGTSASQYSLRYRPGFWANSIHG
jgi:hypothetical protein